MGGGNRRRSEEPKRSDEDHARHRPIIPGMPKEEAGLEQQQQQTHCLTAPPSSEQYHGHPSPRRHTVELLLRGKYVLTSAAERTAGVLTDGAVLVRGDSVAEVGAFQTLRRRHRQARV